MSQFISALLHQIARPLTPHKNPHTHKDKHTYLHFHTDADKDTNANQDAYLNADPALYTSLRSTQYQHNLDASAKSLSCHLRCDGKYGQNVKHPARYNRKI